MPVITHPRIESALDIVAREIRYTTAEQRAFDRFRGRLDDVSPAATGAQPAGGGVLGGTTSIGGGDAGPSASLRAVRTAYEGTVLATPHFESVYEESLREHMAAEFGRALTAQVCDGQALTPALHETLCVAATQASDDRAAFLRSLEREQASLESVRETLGDCERRAVELGQRTVDTTDSQALARLDRAHARLGDPCREAAEARQSLLHNRTVARFSGVEADSLLRFLYEDCDWTCPALAAVAECLATIRTHRRRCLR